MPTFAGTAPTVLIKEDMGGFVSRATKPTPPHPCALYRLERWPPREAVACSAGSTAALGSAGLTCNRITRVGGALLGGGSNPLPVSRWRCTGGPVSRRVEECNRDVLEVLREPLEFRETQRLACRRQAEFPALFQLLAAMNPCPCGFLLGLLRQVHWQLGSGQPAIALASRPALDRSTFISRFQPFPRSISDRANPASRVRHSRSCDVSARPATCAQETECPLSVKEIAEHCISERTRIRSARQAISTALDCRARAYSPHLKVCAYVADLTRRIRHLDDACRGKPVQYRRYERV